MTPDPQRPAHPAGIAATDTGRGDTIDLQDFLKREGLVETGGEAKFRIQGGEVRLNGSTETRRRRKLKAGDVVEIYGEEYRVEV